MPSNEVQPVSDPKNEETSQEFSQPPAAETSGKGVPEEADSAEVSEQQPDETAAQPDDETPAQTDADAPQADGPEPIDDLDDEPLLDEPLLDEPASDDGSSDAADEANVPATDAPATDTPATDTPAAETPAAQTQEMETTDTASNASGTDDRIPGADDRTVALPVVPSPPPAPQPKPGPAPDPADAPTVQIPVRSHTPKAPPQRIPPRTTRPAPPQPEPARPVVQPTPTRIPPARSRGRIRWTKVATTLAVLVVLGALAAVAVVFFQDRAQSSPENRIRASIDTFVTALGEGDLATLQSTTCGGLAEFYATVDPAAFDDIHRLAVEQGEIPVVTSVDRIQITEETAIAEATAHTSGNPADSTPRTFDLALVDDEWKVCSE